MPDQPIQSSQPHEEMLESLEQQLVSLYEEKQLAGADQAVMRETITNLEAQIVELYREKEEAGPMVVAMARKDETITSLEAQLVSIYGEREALAMGV